MIKTVPLPTGPRVWDWQVRALSLKQPWATLVGCKLIETRSWWTGHRGPLLIHASQGFSLEDRELCGTEPFRSILAEILGIARPLGGNAWREIANRLPLGQIITSCELTDCLKMDDFSGVPESLRSNHARLFFDISTEGPLTATERAFGLYEAGRSAWILDDVKRLDRPVVCKGSLGLWQPSPEVRAEISAQLYPATLST